MWFRALGWLFALLGALCLLVLGIAYVPVMLGAWTELPLWPKIVGGIGAALIGLWLFMDWGSLSQLGKDQTVQRSATASFATLLALAVMIAVNVVAEKYDERWDVTKEKRFTLSQQSIDIAKSLDREVQVLGFFNVGSPEATNFRNLVENYQQHTTLIKAEYHDPYSNPMLVQQMEVDPTYGTVILKAGDATQQLESDFGEEAFTNALIKVTSDVQHSVCLLGGHGEAEALDDSAMGFSTAVQKLEGQNYKVQTVNLLEKALEPASCKITIVAAPRSELLPVERDRLAQYVAAGGNLVVLLDPLLVPETAADLARFGVKVGNDVVIEADPNRQIQGGDPTFVALDESSWDIHPITEKLRGVVIMRLARSVAEGDEIPGLNVQVLARASADSWGETNLADTTTVPNPDPGVDVVGNVPVAAVVEVADPAAIRTDTPAAAAATPPGLPIAAPITPAATPLPPAAGGKVAVFGDADFAGNQLILGRVNQDLLLNTIAWMAGETAQISIRSNEAAKGRLDVTLGTGILAGILAIVVFPGLALVGAVGTYLRRKNL